MSSTASWFERVRDTYSNWFVRESDTGTIDGDGYLPAILVETTTDAYLTADFYYEIEAAGQYDRSASTDLYLSVSTSAYVLAEASAGTSLGVTVSVDYSIDIYYDVTASTIWALSASISEAFNFFPGSLTKSANTIWKLSADLGHSIRTDINKRGSLVWNRKKKRYVAVATSV